VRRGYTRSHPEPGSPIPNPEVKLDSADDTWWETAWESRSSPRGLYRSSERLALRSGALFGVHREGPTQVGPSLFNPVSTCRVERRAQTARGGSRLPRRPPTPRPVDCRSRRSRAPRPASPGARSMLPRAPDSAQAHDASLTPQAARSGRPGGLPGPQARTTRPSGANQPMQNPASVPSGASTTRSSSGR